MNPPIASGEAEVLASDIDHLSINPAEQHIADMRDERLIYDLAEHHVVRVPSYETHLNFVNGELAKRAKESYSATEMAGMEQFLDDKRVIEIPIVRGYKVTVDGVERDVAMVTATETAADGANHGDMSSMLYLRDQIQAASALMELFLQDPDKYAQEGETAKELLISALHLMSTPAQLERFETVMRLGKQAGQADWPHISLLFNDLDGKGPNNWRNKQDSFQMLAYTTLDAIDRGFLQVDDLAESHQQFLSSIVPLLESVNFPYHENSGSWEEVEAVRTSVMAVETAMLHKMKTLIEKDTSLDFLAAGHMGNFRETLDKMIDRGLRELGRRLPDESPDSQDPIKFRQADAALVYVLQYNLPALLAEREIPIAANEGEPMSAEMIENLVLDQLSTLIDPVTHGMIRYPDDSYLGLNATSNTGRLTNNAIKRKVQKEAMQEGREIDLDEKQRLRNQYTPSGRPAAWTHPLSQIASWAASRSISVGEHQLWADHYRDLSIRFLNAALSTVTGENQYYAAMNDQGVYELKQVPAYKLPECYVTYQTPTSAELHVPSPHTPLNWSSAMLREAVGLLRISTVQQANHKSVSYVTDITS